MFCLLLPSCFSGVDSQRAGVHQDVQPLPQGAAADSGGSRQGPLLHSWRPQADRRLCLPHLRTLGEEGRAAESSRPLSKHGQDHAAGPGGLWCVKGQPGSSPHWFLFKDLHVPSRQCLSCRRVWFLSWEIHGPGCRACLTSHPRLCQF